MVREPKSLWDMVIPYEDMLTVFQKVIMLHYIYGFYDLTSDKFEYIGQTINPKIRYSNHIRCAYDENDKAYDYPLYRRIRKYGLDNFRFIIIEENIKSKEIDDREIYWIAYYDTYWHGCNQTTGGKSIVYYNFHIEVYEELYRLLKYTDLTYRQIGDILGIKSEGFISQFNRGKKSDVLDVEYPIRSLERCQNNRKTAVNSTFNCKLTDEVVLQVYDLIKYTTYTYTEIGQMYDIPFGTVAMLNKGGAKHYSEICPYNLPIRKKYAQQPRRNSK